VRVSRPCFTSDTRRVTRGRNPVTSHERNKNDGSHDYEKRNISMAIYDTYIH